MLNVVGGARRTTSKRKIQQTKSADVGESVHRIQWTVKGIDKETLELSRRAARKRGMKFGAWVDQTLRSAATGEVEAASVSPVELMKKIAKIEATLEARTGELKDQTNNLQHDLRVLHLLMPQLNSR
jgi:hypothetical protein